MVAVKSIIKKICGPLLYAWGGVRRLGYGHFGGSSCIRRPMRIVGRHYISIGENVHVLDGLRMEAIDKWRDKEYLPKIEIRDDVVINQNCHITCANSVVIGKGTCINADVLITDIEHRYVPGMSAAKTGLKVGSVQIGDFVTVGMGARIMGKNNIKIGDNAIIGANAVIVRDVPANAVVAGIPAHVVKILSGNGDME